MTKEELLQEVRAVIAAPSCYSGLKEAAEAYLAAVDQAGEQAAAERLLAELEADVCSIDDVIPFFASNEAKKLFGEDTKVKFRPHHFPFTEPSAEMDVSCFKCGGKGNEKFLYLHP